MAGEERVEAQEQVPRGEAGTEQRGVANETPAHHRPRSPLEQLRARTGGGEPEEDDPDRGVHPVRGDDEHERDRHAEP